MIKFETTLSEQINEIVGVLTLLTQAFLKKSNVEALVKYLDPSQRNEWVDEKYFYNGFTVSEPIIKTTEQATNFRISGWRWVQVQTAQDENKTKLVCNVSHLLLFSLVSENNFTRLTATCDPNAVLLYRYLLEQIAVNYAETKQKIDKHIHDISSYKDKRLKDVEERIQMNLQLQSQYEENLQLEDDPRKMMRNKKNIKRLIEERQRFLQEVEDLRCEAS